MRASGIIADMRVASSHECVSENADEWLYCMQGLAWPAQSYQYYVSKVAKVV